MKAHHGRVAPTLSRIFQGWDADRLGRIRGVQYSFRGYGLLHFDWRGSVRLRPRLNIVEDIHQVMIVPVEIMTVTLSRSSSPSFSLCDARNLVAFDIRRLRPSMQLRSINACLEVIFISPTFFLGAIGSFTDEPALRFCTLKPYLFDVSFFERSV